MNPESFKTFVRAMCARRGWTADQVAAAIGITKSNLHLYQRGRRYDRPDPVEIPKPVRLACAAVLLGVEDFSGEALEELLDHAGLVLDERRQARETRGPE